jgi:hypothetical protein
MSQPLITPSTPATTTRPNATLIRPMNSSVAKSCCTLLEASSPSTQIQIAPIKTTKNAPPPRANQPRRVWLCIVFRREPQVEHLSMSLVGLLQRVQIMAAVVLIKFLFAQSKPLAPSSWLGSDTSVNRRYGVNSKTVPWPKFPPPTVAPKKLPLPLGVSP